MKILLSGGWGYGNIGDDAILLASLELLHSKYPSATIIITSHNPEYTCKVVNNKYKVIDSVHKQIFQVRAYKFLKVKGHVVNTAILPQIVQRLYARVTRNLRQNDTVRVLSKYIKKHSFVDLRKPFKDTDLFVMSGGGYFNSWEDSLISRIIELELAQSCRVKSVIIGQTLGPFTIPQAKTRLMCALKSAHSIYVRDIESQKDLISMGIESRLAPDLALSQNPILNEVKTNTLAIVPAEIPVVSREAFVEGIAHIINEHQLSATVVVTRLYIQDIEIAKRIAKKLNKKCREKSVKLVIPEVYSDIENALMQSKYVISRNLHGLILAWRSGAKCLCLNDERKFVAFMNQIGHPEYIIDINNLDSKVLCCKFDSLTHLIEDNSKREELQQEVISTFLHTISQ